MVNRIGHSCSVQILYLLGTETNCHIYPGKSACKYNHFCLGMCKWTNHVLGHVMAKIFYPQMEKEQRQDDYFSQQNILLTLPTYRSPMIISSTNVGW